MKVEIENSSIIKKFGELKCGEIFVCDNIVYVKMNDLLVMDNAFEFDSATMDCIQYNEVVAVPKEVILKVEI